MCSLQRFLIIGGVALATAACSNVRDDLGLAKKAPDEFAVVRNAPLSLPPNFNLRPPKPGEIGEGRAEQRDQARTVLTGRAQPRSQATPANVALTSAQPAAQPASYSFIAGRVERPLGDIGEHVFAARPTAGGGAAPGLALGRGEQALLARLDADDVDPDIRRRVDQESKVLAADDRNIVERMMFWRELAAPGVVVDAGAEASRINENSALGKPVTEGETPQVEVERLSSGFSGIKLF